MFLILFKFYLNSKRKYIYHDNKIKEKNLSINDYITYETNIISISNIISNKNSYLLKT